MVMDPSPASSITVDSALSPSSSPSPPPGSPPKLRLMCSYGGHIVPRPLDKTLCYAGGETRIVAIDRRNAYSLPSLTTHLSKSLLNGQPFCLKYQLPNHDLDSLVSISTDEDLINMIDEYDRLSSSGSSSRLRFFLFPDRSGSGGGGEVHDPTSEEWFIDALRNVGVVAKGRSSDSGDGLGLGMGESEGKVVPESIVLEKNSSYGSTSSSASASNSPAIRGSGGDEGVGVKLHDIKVALPSVDSVGSNDSSLASPNFSPQAIVYQDAPAFVEPKVVVETESNASDRSPRSDLLTPVQVPGYIVTKPMDQQQQQVSPPPPPQAPPAPQPQYIHPAASQSHYVAQYYPSSVPVTSYPTMYQPYVQPQQPVHYQMNKPYPVYMMPVGQTQNPYDMSMQCNLATPQSVASTHAQLPSNPVMVAPPVVYEGYKPAVSAPEYAAKVYRAPAVATQPVHVPVDDLHRQVVAFPPANPPSQHVAAAVTLESANYISEYEDTMHAQIYKTQPSGPTLPSQLTTTNTTPVMLSDAFTQLHVDSTKHWGLDGHRDLPRLRDSFA